MVSLEHKALSLERVEPDVAREPSELVGTQLHYTYARPSACRARQSSAPTVVASTTKTWEVQPDPRKKKAVAA